MNNRSINMVDTYTMVLWAKSNKFSVDTQSKQVFDILTLLGQIDYLKPRYQTVFRKKDAIEFELTIENVKTLILNKRDKQFPELGSQISFFTSLNEDESAGISISIGSSNSRFVNSVVIDLNWDYKKMNLSKFDELEFIFKGLINIFKPFYGCVASNSDSEKYNEYFDDRIDKPNSIFDMNFFGKDIIEKINRYDKILKKVYEYQEIDGGYFIRLLKEPLDISNVKHVEFQKQINKLIGVMS